MKRKPIYYIQNPQGRFLKSLGDNSIPVQWVRAEELEHARAFRNKSVAEFEIDITPELDGCVVLEHWN